VPWDVHRKPSTKPHRNFGESDHSPHMDCSAAKKFLCGNLVRLQKNLSVRPAGDGETLGKAIYPFYSCFLLALTIAYKQGEIFGIFLAGNDAETDLSSGQIPAPIPPPPPPYYNLH
jgi:hypothetical protein